MTAKNFSDLALNDKYVQNYILEKSPDYTNRLNANRFIASIASSLNTFKCSLAITKYYDNHAITNSSNTEFDYYYKARGISSTFMSELMAQLESSPLYNIEYILSTTKTSSYFTIVIKNTYLNEHLYTFVSYDIKDIFPTVSDDTSLAIAISIDKKIMYISNQKYESVINNYINNNVYPKKYKLFEFSPKSQANISTITCYYLYLKNQYYLNFLPHLLTSIGISLIILFIALQ